MNLKEFYLNFLSELDFRDDYNLIRLFEKIKTKQDACIIQYYYPDKSVEIRKFIVNEIIKYQGRMDDEEFDFNYYILKCLDESFLMDLHDLRKEIVISNIKLKIGAVILRELKALGFLSFNIKYQNRHSFLIDHLSDSYRKFQFMDIDCFINEFPLKYFKPHINQFQKYGAEQERPLSSNQSISWVNWECYVYEKIIIPRKNTSFYSVCEGHNKPDYDINMDGRDQEERTTLLYSVFLKKLKENLDKKVTSGFFPHLMWMKTIIMIVNAENNQIDVENMEVFTNKVKNISIPGYKFAITTTTSNMETEFTIRFEQLFNPKYN